MILINLDKVDCMEGMDLDNVNVIVKIIVK